MLRIIGDICFADWYFDKGRGVGTSIARGNNPFGKLPRKAEDFWIGNFECVCADSDKHFVVRPDILNSVPHLDLYGVANNHSMQIGDKGYLQTIEYLETKGIPYVGSLSQKSRTFVHQGKKVGILAFSMRPDNFTSEPLYWHLPEYSEIDNVINTLEDCDFKIAFIHWGYEFMNRPNIEQRQMAHWLIDSGIDMVIGMHPHIMQVDEQYKGKHIFYSLGNAVFNMSWEPTKYGLLVNVDLANEKPAVSTQYLYIEKDFFPKIVENLPTVYSRQFLDKEVNKIEENEKYFATARTYNSQYTQANRKDILKRMWKMPFNEKYELISDFIKRRFLKK